MVPVVAVPDHGLLGVEGVVPPALGTVSEPAYQPDRVPRVVEWVLAIVRLISSDRVAVVRVRVVCDDSCVRADLADIEKEREAVRAC